MSGKQSQTGEISWSSVETSEKRGDSVFLNMRDEGKYKMRIVSRPYQYYCHWVEDVNNKRRKVNATLDGNDPVCIKSGKPPQLKWLIKVLYRDPNVGTVLRILDAGPQIMGQIKTFHEDTEDFGDVSKYDIIIVKNPKEQRPLYSVQATGQAAHPQALSKEELQSVTDSGDPQSDNFIDVDKMCQPWPKVRIQAILDGMDPREAALLVPDAPTASTDTSTTETSSDDDDNSFMDLEL